MYGRTVLYTYERFTDNLCKHFNVYVFNELSSNFLTVSNADASIFTFLKRFIFYFVLINVWFQIFSPVFRMVYYIHALHSSDHIYIAGTSGFLTLLI
jgi:hypothetical protein